MLGRDFCEFLEIEICKALSLSNDEQLKGFWCDGVIANQPSNYYSQKFINDNRRAVLKAFVGKDGQTEYELTLLFGSKALSRYARGLNINQCLPSDEKGDWFTIDTGKRTIEIKLD